MRRKRTVPPNRLGVNITALSDIMLCLLIFFMLVSKRGVDTGADKELELPHTLLGIDIDDLGNTIPLNIYPGADQPIVETVVDGRRVTLRITEPSGDGIREPLRDHLAALRRHNPNFRVILYADRERLTYHFLEPVLLACAAAELNDVTFATRRHEP